MNATFTKRGGRLLVVLLLCIPYHAAHAHNGGILVQAQNGRLVLGLDSEAPGEPPQMGVYAESSLLRPTLYFQDVPSFISLATPPAGTEALPEATELYWDFLPMTIGGVTSNLFYWDGQGTSVQDVQFGPVPQQGVTLGIYNVTDPGNPSAIVHGTAEMIPGNLIGKTDATGSGLRLHRHNYFLVDDGDGGMPPTVVPEGVYLIAIQLRMEGYRASEPFFVLPATFELASTSLASVTAAVEWVDQNRQLLILDGDYDFDGDVDDADYLVWREHFGMTGPFPLDGTYPDGNRDNIVNAADFVVWKNASSSMGSNSTTTVPEPATLWYVLASLLATSRLRR